MGLAYQAALDALGARSEAAAPLPDLIPASGATQIKGAANGGHPSTARTVSPIRKELRRRNKAHLAFVGAQPCLVCKRCPCDAHHLKFAQPRALGRKVSDEFTVPLCREHHNELHRHGNEMAWWANLRLPRWKRQESFGRRPRFSGANGQDRDEPFPRRKRSSKPFRRPLQPMTSFRRIEANRRNALRSTGPRTEEGKRQTRRNAVRHGLCAETVIDNVEDIEDYRAFEAAVIADYDAQTAVERELVLRLASLLWRLRRATAIETDLFGSRPKSCASGGTKRHRRNPCPFALSKPLWRLVRRRTSRPSS